MITDIEQFEPLAIHDLDLSLINKLIPTPPTSLVNLTKYAELTSSICPVKYRSCALARESRARAAAAPQLLTGGELEHIQYQLPSFEAKEKLQIVALGKQGKYQSIRIPKKDKGYSSTHSFIDWVNFTFKTAQLPLNLKTGHQAVTDYEYVQALSVHIYNIFGIGVTEQRQSGMNFYKNSFDIGRHGEGLVCIGGQRDSCLVTMKGQGLMASKPGWELRLKQFLEKVPGSQLTRIDLASDNFKSDVDMNGYLAMYRADLFNNAARTPNIECLGNWERPNGKGRTMYIGGRTSGKLLRIYEKGKHIANGYDLMFPDWIRTELELKNIDRVIPLDALINPGQYLAGAYPALAGLHKVQSPIKTYKNTAKATYTKAVDTCKTQYGKYIYVFSEIHGVEETIKMLTSGKEEIPKRLIFPTFNEYGFDDFIHAQKIHTTLFNEVLAA